MTAAWGEADMARAYDRLSVDERARASRFRSVPDRRDYVAAHALLRDELSRSSPASPESWRFVTDPRGKPALADLHPALSFSLSHGRGIVACAVAAGVRVGVDVECATRDVAEIELARRFFSPHELAHLERAGATRRSRFFELWTLKEAYAKAAEVGLVHALASAAFEIGDDGHVQFAMVTAAHASDWHLMLMAPAPAYRLAAAAWQPGADVRFDVADADAT